MTPITPRGFSNISKSLETIKPIVQDFVKKTKSLTINEKPAVQGEGTIGISPFDDYFLFNIYTESNGESIPLDISNNGDLYLSFFDPSGEIVIKNIKNVEGIDPKLGQVVFKITKTQSKVILKFTDNRFYISSKLQVGTSSSDESVLYTGKFLAFSTQKTASLQDKYDAQVKDSTALINNLQSLNDELNTLVIDLKKDIANLTSTNSSLISNNQNLVNTNSALMAELSADNAARIVAEQHATAALELQKASEEALKNLNNKIAPKEIRYMGTKDMEKQLANLTLNSRTFISGDKTSSQAGKLDITDRAGTGSDRKLDINSRKGI